MSRTRRYRVQRLEESIAGVHSVVFLNNPFNKSKSGQREMGLNDQRYKYKKKETPNQITATRSCTGKLMRNTMLERSENTGKTVWHRRERTHSLNKQGGVNN